MRYGYYAPNFDVCGDANVLADLAAAAEDAGWDGFFIWDHLQFIEPAVDPWIALTAMALRTRRILLGTLVTPVPRRHIAKLAREVISLDRLSQGRLVLGAGAGFPHLPDYAAFGDQTDRASRAAKLDEGLHLLDRLMSGEPVNYDGAHYQVNCAAFQRPIQSPRVPIWVAAAWPARRPLDRALRWDGVVPVGRMGLEVAVQDIAAIRAYVAERRDRPIDITCFGITHTAEDRERVRSCYDAGATWWIDYYDHRKGSLSTLKRRLELGPPRL